ncbi:MAG: hypothetical protein JO122_19435 [Acetobacteraceae bacterium]|nr:hypothetical protein [Acetobacteraceae bacterium]
MSDIAPDLPPIESSLPALTGSWLRESSFARNATEEESKFAAEQLKLAAEAQKLGMSGSLPTWRSLRSLVACWALRLSLPTRWCIEHHAGRVSS